jgi:hypothetical protein
MFFLQPLFDLVLAVLLPLVSSRYMKTLSQRNCRSCAVVPAHQFFFELNVRELWCEVAFMRASSSQEAL